MYLARNRETGGKVVIKLVERGASVTRYVSSELIMHYRCSGHPFIVQLLDLFLTPNHLAIVLEYVPSLDALELVNQRGGLPEDEARWIFQQLLVAMMYLHSLGACNREMKLENVMLAAPEASGIDMASAIEAGSDRVDPGPRPLVKLQDFMYSKSEQINSDPHSALGSLPYTAPEVLNNTIKEDSAADVWALGVVLFKLCTGIFPFEREEDGDDARRSVQAVLGRIARVDYVIPEGLSPGLRDLLSRMLVRIPSERMRMEDVLAHPWVQQALPSMCLHASGAAAAAVPPMTEAALRAVIEEAQVSIRPLNSDNVDDMADEILNEEEADDLLEELCLG